MLARVRLSVTRTLPGVDWEVWARAEADGVADGAVHCALLPILPGPARDRAVGGSLEERRMRDVRPAAGNGRLELWPPGRCVVMRKICHCCRCHVPV